MGGIFKWSGNESCSLCDTEMATGFEIPLVQHKAATDQSPAIAGLRANIGRYHLRHLVITGQVALSGLLVKANNRGVPPNTVSTLQASHVYRTHIKRQSIKCILIIQLSIALSTLCWREEGGNKNS